MPTLEIDGKQVTVEDGINLIQAADRLGIQIPHYCFHPGLSIAGNCRMCLVEIEKMPKLQIACNCRVAEGMVVRTKSDRVKQAQAAILEFLLVNHPIDCPICDQAGECKLQDYYMDYDRRPSFVPLEQKVRKAKAVDIGPLVMLDQERCILCTRCTRFLDEVTKTGELGILERADRCRISLFPGRRLDNPYSANVVDICPVGALTNKDFRFRARVWYLEHTASICPSCATGCNIDIHHRGGEILRFRPRYNAGVNRYWMCDEGRMSYRRFQGEGRLLEPVVRDSEGWVVRDWDTAFREVAERLQKIRAEQGPGAIAGITSAHATNEEAFLFCRLIRDGFDGRVAGLSWSPPAALHDEFLIDADKNPNTAGLRALKVPLDDLGALLRDAAAGRVKALLILRGDLQASHGPDVLRRLAEEVDFLVVVDTHYHATAEAASVLLPIASFAETDGTYVNRAGRVQCVRQAFPAPGRARPGWQVLAGLGTFAMGMETYADAEAVFARLGASVEVFRSLSHASIGGQGAQLSAAPV